MAGAVATPGTIRGGVARCSAAVDAPPPPVLDSKAPVGA